MTARRIAIIGGSGQLGTALRAAFADREVVAPGHQEVPLESGAALAHLLEHTRPDVLINCSAFHHVETCEREPERAFAINALAVDAAAQACASRSLPFVTVSTDFVFDGVRRRPYREDDATNPLNAYGASKVAGESLTRRHGGPHLIVRTSAVFGTIGTSSKGYTLLEKVLAQAERSEPTEMVADMVFSPSYAPDVARAIRDLIDAQAYGTHHVTNEGACSWYEFVRTAFEKAGLRDAELVPVADADRRSLARRPMFSPLENTTFAPAGIAPLPPWQDALDAFLAVRAARRSRVPTAG